MALTRKRRVFVAEYLRCWNATEAAKRAGYSERTAYSQGQRLLKNVEVAGLIRERLAEKAMGADEALTRLSEQARAEYAAYLRPSGSVDLDRLLEDGNGHLVKGTRWDRQGNLIVEFYDAQSALALIGRHHKLFTDNVEHHGRIELDVGSAREELERRIAALAERARAQGVPGEPER